jgi:hypothetical protein
MGATKIMVIRHAEKPGLYGGTAYSGVDEFGTVSGAAGAKHLVTLGWERAGALITLFASPWGPKTPLATPKFLFASNPDAKPGDDTSDEAPSQRPYETLTALKAKLNLTIDKTHLKSDFAEMVTSALACEGVVLIAWQHEDIALKTKTGNPPSWPDAYQAQCRHRSPGKTPNGSGTVPQAVTSARARPSAAKGLWERAEVP